MTKPPRTARDRAGLPSASGRRSPPSSFVNTSICMAQSARGTCVYLIMPAPDTECFQIFLDTLAKKYPRHFILLFVDGAGNHPGDQLGIPANIMLHLLPPYSPELNPQENLWDEIREKIFKNYALKSMNDVYAKLGRTLHRTQSNARQIHHVVPLHRQVT